VRRFGTDDVAETEAEHGGDGLPESRREEVVGMGGHDEWEGPPFITTH
jgi:hypothetical protein